MLVSVPMAGILLLTRTESRTSKLASNAARLAGAAGYELTVPVQLCQPMAYLVLRAVYMAQPCHGIAFACYTLGLAYASPRFACYKLFNCAPN